MGLTKAPRPEAAGAFESVLERRHPDVPVHFCAPATVVAALGQDRGFAAEVAVNGAEIGRRIVQPCGDGRWVLELTKAHCERLGVGPGDRLQVALQPAPDTPPELEERIAEKGLKERWASLPEERRRALAEPVFAAKKPATREARIRKALARL